MNRLLKSLSTILIIMMIVSIIGCSSTKAPEVEVAPAAAAAPAEKAVVAAAPKAEAPKAEAPKAEAPKAEAPKAEAPKAEAETGKSVVSHEVAGYKATVEIEKGAAVVSYPSFITDEELFAFGMNCVEKVPALYDMVTYEKLGDGQVKFYFSEDYTQEDIEWACGLLFEELDSYVADMFPAPAVEEVKAVEAPVAEVAAPAPAPVAAPAPSSNLPFGVEPIVKNAQGDAEFDLFVVHTNDVHGRVVPMDGGMGYSKLSTMLKAGRAITNNILLLDAGDTFHGTNYSNFFTGKSVVTLLGMLGYDAMVPGNHDFDYGFPTLVKLADECAKEGVAVVSANVLDQKGYNLFQPYAIYDFNGFKVCVIGITTPETPYKVNPLYVKGLSFKDPIIAQNAQYAVDMAHQVADYVIVLGHVGIDGAIDNEITTDNICKYIKGIDLFIDGHDHEDYPQGRMSTDTLVVSTGSYLKNVGVVQLHVKDKKVTSASAMLIPAEDVLNPSASALATSFGIVDIPNDPEVDEYIAALDKEIDAQYGAVVADLPVDFIGDRKMVRNKQTNLSKFIVEAMTAETGADFTFINSGGIRASLKKGEITYKDVYNVLPFGNYAVLSSVTGEEIYEALEYGYSVVGESEGRYPSSDLRVVYSRTAEPGKRIKRVALPDGTLLDRNKTYTVCCHDFLSVGGDGYTQFGNIVRTDRGVLEMVVDAFKKQYPAK
ncbi:MAG: 5'-nucleotidase C-terminal domain-containing protein [Sphaerochaetaceae bacterium]|nr:5'-nucleotidase C-terminal domain-containing protein [Sphaerochaetaceae bacterium]